MGGSPAPGRRARDRDLARLAELLDRSGVAPAARSRLESADPAVAALARAVDRHLDAEAEREAGRREADERFREQLAALSHDIRTPLAGAQGYLQLYGRSADPAERERCLAEAASRLSAMRELTDKLFDYAKAADSDSPLAREPVEALPVLAEVLAGAYPQLKERGWDPAVDFEDEDVAVLADAEALSRVFSNLLANALRHGTSAPRVSQRLVPPDGGEGRGMVEFAFSNGVGDPAAIDADRLFERFYRADAARSGEGSGLGLSIVASLVRRMGGRVSARIKGDELVIAVALPAA